MCQFKTTKHWNFLHSYASYTKSSGHELAPLLREPASPPQPRRPSPMNIQLSCTALAPPPLKAGGAKICPVTSKNSLPKNAYVMPKDKKPPNATGLANGKSTGNSRSASVGGSNGVTSKETNGSAGSAGSIAGSNCKQPHSSSSSRSFPLFSSGGGSSTINNNNSSSKSISIVGARDARN